MKDLSWAADWVGLDFVTFVSTLQISGENISDLREQKADVLSTYLQEIGVSLANRMEAKYQLVEAFRPYGAAVALGKIVKSLERKIVGRATPLSGPSEVIDINAALRLYAEPTTGMMDFEASMRASALLLFAPDHVRDYFKKMYPKVVLRYQEILRQKGIIFIPLLADFYREKNTITKTKEELKALALKYIDIYGERLDVFIEDKEALSAIGLSGKLDEWQKYNYTDAWYQLVKNYKSSTPDQEDEYLAFEEVLKMMKSDSSADLKRFHQVFMSQQLLNPKFLDFLLSRAEGDELSLLYEIKDSVNRYKEAAKELRIACFKTAQEEGPLEYDSKFQILISALVTKMLSIQAGNFNPDNKDSLYWHIYKIISIRELSNPLFMTRGSVFARDIAVDLPYSIPETIDGLEQLQQLFIEKKIIKNMADLDIASFVLAVSDIVNSDFSRFSNLADKDKEEIKDFFAFHVAETFHTAVNRSQKIIWQLLVSQKKSEQDLLRGCQSISKKNGKRKMGTVLRHLDRMVQI